MSSLMGRLGSCMGGGALPGLASLFVALHDAPWMIVAYGEVGQSEIQGEEHNPRIIQYHASTGLRAQEDEVAWCSSFVNWCLQQAGVSGTNSAGAASWLRWRHGATCTARYGAITVIHNPAAANTSLSRSGNHVGFLVEDSPTHFVLLGGNQSNSVRVSQFRKRRWQLRGYRWPDSSA